jgi:lipopolysaccharide/colanic/teichoic acid biosynthesis glycosyltransferase
MQPFYAIAKRIFDIVFSLLVIIIGMPLWILVAIIIKIDSKGKVFYSQPRVGKDNKIFTIYKFRSMAQAKQRMEQKWTTVGDPRVTKFGRIIRKTHLDEVPQFYNVLIGDMSTIGPRPEQPNFVEEFSSQLLYYNRRHLVRPGITGWWQVKYKIVVLGLDEVKNRTKDDFYYIENMSFQLDFEILVRTVWCVLKGHGQA